MKRIVFQFPGYDPMPPDVLHARFDREMKRFQRTWNVRAEAGAPCASSAETSWTVVTAGPDWRTETLVRTLRWDDLIAAQRARPSGRRLLLGLLTFVDFVASGALAGYLRTSWRYAGFFLYPFVVLIACAALGVGLATIVIRNGGLWALAVGPAVGLAAFLALVHGLGRRLHLDHLLDDWIFARDYVRAPIPDLEPRLEAFAEDLIDAARQRQVDEIVLIGHSLGAVLAIDVLARALRANPNLPTHGPRVCLLTVGSSVLKIGLHRGASRFREAVDLVSAAPALLWAEYQALKDIMNFYATNPVEAMRLPHRDKPIVRLVSIRKMLTSASYKTIRGRVLRLHYQFVSGNEVRSPYDYYMFLLGPVSFKEQVTTPEGATLRLGTNGGLLKPETA